MSPPNVDHKIVLSLLPPSWRTRLETAHIEVVPGGICNELYRLDAAEGAFALRINNPYPQRLGLDPGREGRVLDAIVAQPWAPDALYRDDRILLTRWIEGDPPAGGELTRLSWLAHALNSVHAQTGDLPTVDIPTQLYRLADRLGAQAGPARRQIEHLLADYRPARHRVLCHHDWHPGNVVIGASGWTLLDWEFAGLGDPCLDIGAAINGFSLTRPALEPLSQRTCFGVEELQHASAIMEALEIVWYAANPELKPGAEEALSQWMKRPMATGDN
ncbi:phosphotransferase [Marinobacter fonticola]|uniref:phosphotransferase n=1 Tax=Marinobacter fonticola TaxID=2603215 RepID=UPI0011E69196|nr:phosphotransferase [Marinobacter fonticola]